MKIDNVDTRQYIITTRKVNRGGRVITYAHLYNPVGRLLVSATLEYIAEWLERNASHDRPHP